MALRWGIVSSGNSSHDFVLSLQVLPKSDHEVVAVAGKMLSCAQNFAKMHDIPQVHGDYQSIAEDENVDIVYVGSLTGEHFEISKLMMEHGKHVLCETPMTMNEKQTLQLVELSREKRVLLMEGISTRSFPAYSELRKQIDCGLIGEPLYVTAHFGFDLQHIDRIAKMKLSGGTVLNLGVYVLQFQQFIFRGQQPLEVIARGELNTDGVDISSNAIIRYPDGKFAMVSTSARTELSNEGLVFGTKGMIRVPELWCATELLLPKKMVRFNIPHTAEDFSFAKCGGMYYQAEVARQCIKDGQIESSNISHEESVQLAQLMDTMRSQIGVVYPEDSQ